MEAQWIQEYKKNEEKAKYLLPLEEREIFVKYSEKDELFFQDNISQGRIINYNNPDKDKIEITRLSDAIEMPSEIKKFTDKDRIQAFINSKVTDGIIIKIKDYAEIKDPVKISTTLSENNASKILIFIGKKSKVSIIIDSSVEKSKYSGQNIDIITDKESNTELILIQDSAGITAKNYRIYTAGYLNLIELITNTGLTRERIWLDLLEHAEIKIRQAVIGNGNAYFDIETEINHTNKDTKSNVAYRSALADSSKAVYKGVILQGDNAYNSYAYLSESSLILSKEAKSISVPSLEIENNELKAYHSASSEPINKNVIFYLMSRGLETEMAKKMIINGFLSQLFGENELGYNIISDKISEKLDSISFRDKYFY